MRGFCFVKEKGGATTSLWSWSDALSRPRQGKMGTGVEAVKGSCNRGEGGESVG